MRGKWTTIGEVLSSLLERRGLREGIRRHTALLGWEETVGTKIAERAWPLEVRGKTLFVGVNGSAWIHELLFLKADILRKLNEKAGGGTEAIEEIIFVADDERRTWGVPRTGRRQRNGRDEAEKP
ncbi:MAG: DUF721 domain-containing protein [Candidatus Eisenbacteria bacterium]